jgi:hypothetical protein
VIHDEAESGRAHHEPQVHAGADDARRLRRLTRCAAAQHGEHHDDVRGNGAHPEEHGAAPQRDGPDVGGRQQDEHGQHGQHRQDHQGDGVGRAGFDPPSPQHAGERADEPYDCDRQAGGRGAEMDPLERVEGEVGAGALHDDAHEEGVRAQPPHRRIEALPHAARAGLNRRAGRRREEQDGGGNTQEGENDADGERTAPVPEHRHGRQQGSRQQLSDLHS